jgi:hypothetical protein
MKQQKWFLLMVLLLALALSACSSQQAAPDAAAEKDPVAMLSGEAKDCVECHATETPGIVADWDKSRHAHEAVSCIDCHQVDADSPMAVKGVEGHENVAVSVSVLVPPSRCAECHEQQVAEFSASGHYRGALQIEPKAAMQTLMFVHEGRENADFGSAPANTGCYQCHGVRLEVDETGHPTNSWPTAGIGTIYPDGSVGNCVACHTRHSFSIEEARKPEACAACHLGPDHPDIEIYENSKHGQIYATEGETWKWDSPVNEWEPGDYRAPTCATCHMSGIGDLQMTHNVSQRLYWNLWAPRSEVRNSDDPMSSLTGNGEQGRAEMKQVCAQCHTTQHTENFFQNGDNAVQLYNVEYFDKAKAMLDDLKERGLLGENPWTDPFQTTYYYLWHHEGRRARQGALMGGPDWAHWHGFFDLMQDIYKLEKIYNYRIETGTIGEP